MPALFDVFLENQNLRDKLGNYMSPFKVKGKEAAPEKKEAVAE